MNQHPTVKELLAARLRSTGHKILRRDPSGNFLDALFSVVSDDIRPFDGGDLLPIARMTLTSTIVNLQAAHYEAQAALNPTRAVQIGKILDAALVCLDQLIEVPDERTGNDEGASG
jgi:hypothetical protein